MKTGDRRQKTDERAEGVEDRDKDGGR